MKEEVLKNFRVLGKSRDWINDKDFNKWGYDVKSKDLGNKTTLPFIDYILEDKSEYPKACDSINPRQGTKYVDPDNDFLVGSSGGLLMNMNFIFVNTDIFSQVADYFKSKGRYCPYEENTIKYNKFWNRETLRRRMGVKARCKLYYKDVDEYYNPRTTSKRKQELLHYVRITGDHYNYLNYGRIERTPNEAEREELDKKGLISVNTLPGFPRFWDADYWYFKVDEFTIRNKFNNCICKARRKGISYKAGSRAANTANLNKAVTTVFAADIIDYLTDSEATVDMAKKNLDWYETQTYWKRGYLSEKLDNIELGYKKTKQGNKRYGFRSKILAVAIGRNESAAIGKKAISIDFEESGKSPNLGNAWGVTLSNIESGAIKIGTGRIYGTAGTKNANWTAFRNIFYDPGSNNMMPFENVWNANSRHKTCCFFISNVWCCEPYIYDGNSLFLSAWKWDAEDKSVNKTNKTSEDAIIYCAQRANSPAEAFIDTQDNLFASPELNQHIQLLYDDPSKKTYIDGWYMLDKTNIKFLSKEECVSSNIFGHNRFHPYIEDVPHTNKTDIHGCVREYLPPIYINGRIPKDLYFITVDTYRIDKNAKTVNVKNSLYSIQCWLRSNTITPYPGKKLVAEYTGRLNTMAENDRITLHMALRYNCGVLPEAYTGEIISNFKAWGYRNKLMLDPTALMDRTIKDRSAIGYGVVVGDGDKKIEGLRELRDFLYEIIGKTVNDTPIYRFNTIDSLSLCLELQRFNLEGNFDRISSAIVAMFEFKKDFILHKEDVKCNCNNKNSKRLAEQMKRKTL